MAIIVVALLNYGCTVSDNATSTVKDASNQSHQSEASSASINPADAKSSEPSQKEIYSDKFISMPFLGKRDLPELQGMFYIDVKVTNKSSKEITVYLKDVSLNDTMVNVGSGVPLELLPGKNKMQSFSGKYEGTGIKGADEIKKIGFKIFIMDESANVIETTKPIQINF